MCLVQGKPSQLSIPNVFWLISHFCCSEDLPDLQREREWHLLTFFVTQRWGISQGNLPAIRPSQWEPNWSARPGRRVHGALQLWMRIIVDGFHHLEMWNLMWELTRKKRLLMSWYISSAIKHHRNPDNNIYRFALKACFDACSNTMGFKGRKDSHNWDSCANSPRMSSKVTITGWWFDPPWTILVGMIIPNMWENKKCSKPPTR